MNANSESALIERLREGDAAALETLMARYVSRVYRVARAIAHTEADAEEVVQDVFLAAIETAVHEELRAALGTRPYERTEVRRGYRNGTKMRTLTGPSRAHPAASYPVWSRQREGMDVGDPAALSAADAGGQ